MSACETGQFVGLPDEDRMRKCVDKCERWTEDAETKELKCTEKCPEWWYSDKDGLCKEEKWRKSTAISVPIAVVVVLAAILLTVLLIRRKKQKEKPEKKKPDGAMHPVAARSTVAHA